jgi:hypothetical protein
VYLRSLLVVALCTAFVVSFVVVLSYAFAGVGSQTTLQTQSPCSSSQGSCPSFSITSASLLTVNYTDELGVVDHAYLVLGLNASGTSPITSVSLFIGSAPAGSVQGPFNPGVSRVLNITLPATVSVSHGKTYLVNVEGFYGDGEEAWKSVEVSAQ